MKKGKIFITIILFIIFIIAMFTFTNAFSVEDLTGNTLPSGSQKTIDNLGQGIIKIIATVGSIISVVMLVALGIKYMLGSVDEKVQYKKTLFPYFVGALILFGASTLSGIVYNIAINL